MSWLIRGDARQLPLADASVNCVITSPPYWGLRKYPDARQIGLESTPDAYVQALVSVFAELWRVLREDGTAWLNLGDSYGGGRNGAPGPQSDLKHRGRLRGWTPPQAAGGFRNKDLCGVPWRVAFALQAAGWYLRSDIIWHKPNPMPESVTDRPTKAHEYLFLLSKSERYHYDADAIKEPSTDSEAVNGYTRNLPSKPDTIRRHDIGYDGHRTRVAITEGLFVSGKAYPFKNRRSVWTVHTASFAGAHFATMPEALVEPCILAGCPLGGIVLDPFCGTGTVLAVAARTGRRGVGVDLSYQDLARERTAQHGLSFTESIA